MKKRTLLVILSVLCVSVSGCQCELPSDEAVGVGKDSVQDEGFAQDGEMVKDDAVYGQCVTVSYRGAAEQYILNESDAVFIRNLFLDENRYVQTAPNCLMDCFLNIDGVEIQYHTDCGNLMRMDNGMSMKLSDSEKVYVNETLGKYLGMGFGEEEVFLPEVSVGKFHLSALRELDVEDSKILYEILSDESRFDDAVSDCLSDCYVLINGKMYLYHSECGTFNDNERGKCITLSQEDKVFVNGILSKYPIIGFDDSESENVVFVVKGEPNLNEPNAYAISLSKNEADIIASIFYNESRFINDLYKCTSDCNVYVNGVMYNYCSSCGTFNDKVNNRGFQLADSEKTTVNEILSEYAVFENSNIPTSQIEIGRAENLDINDSWGLTLRADDVSAEGMTLTFIQHGGVENAELLSGNYYVIEKYLGGEWESVETLIPKDQIAWTLEALLIPTDSKSEWIVNWSFIYGTLDSGKYRIGKNVTCFRETGNYGSKLYYAEFEISDKSSELSEKWGIQLNSGEYSSCGMVLYCTQRGPTLGEFLTVNGRKYSAMTVCMEYWIEKFEEDSWVRLPYITADTKPTWSLMYEMVELDTTMSWNLEWEQLYGALPEGVYRIGKKIVGKLDDGVYETFNIYSEFEVKAQPSKSPVYVSFEING